MKRLALLLALATALSSSVVAVAAPPPVDAEAYVVQNAGTGEVLAERAIPPSVVWRPAVPAPPQADGSGRCVYVLESDGLVGSTRIDFVRSG